MDSETAYFLREAKHDRNRALAYLFEMYGRKIFRAAYVYFGSQEQAEDICQDVFAAASARASGFRGGSKVYTWLYGIFLNKAHDMMRKQYIEERAVREKQETAGIGRSTLLEQDPEELALKEDIRAAVNEAVHTLPEDMKILVIMRYFEGFSGKEMASVLDMSHARVRSRLSEARTALRGILIKEHL